MSMNNKQQFSGSTKAAILLLSFGEEISSEIFKHLNEFEIKRIGSAMSRLGRLDEEIVDSVIVEFYGVLQKNQEIIHGDTEYTKRVIGSAFKGGEAKEIIDDLALSEASLDSLSLIDPSGLAGFLRNEHPQTIAIIMAHLDPAKFGETIKLLPDNLHAEILLRIARLDAVSPELIDDIEDIWKILLMMGIGAFMLHTSDSYIEIMKHLAQEQKLFMMFTRIIFP